MEGQTRKRGINRTKEAVLADYNQRISRHEAQIAEAEEKHAKVIAYHRNCIETLKQKRDASANKQTRISPSAELLKKIKESGKTMEEVIELITKM